MIQHDIVFHWYSRQDKMEGCMRLHPLMILVVGVPILAGCASSSMKEEVGPLALTESAVSPASSFVQPVLKDDHVVAADPFRSGGADASVSGGLPAIERGSRDGLVWLMTGSTQGFHPNDLASRSGEGQAKAGLKGELVVWFDFADARPAPRYRAGQDALRKLRSSNSVLVVGHADAIGSDASNMSLARKRAESVRDWLIAHGVSAANIRLVSKGEREPVASNATAEGRAMNRRVEVYAGD
jgi:hypothetical protein